MEDRIVEEREREREVGHHSFEIDGYSSEIDLSVSLEDFKLLVGSREERFLFGMLVFLSGTRWRWIGGRK